MQQDIIKEFELHKKWIETIGEEGEMLILDEMDLRNFDFFDKILEQSQITECNFNETRLEEINFSGTLLGLSTFRKCYFNECDFYRSDLRYTDFSNSIIKNTRFSKSDWWKADFQNTHLIDCNLIKVFFNETDLSHAVLENIDISAAKFEKTILKDITLINIKGIEEAYVESINIGTIEVPILLYLEQAKEWIFNNCLIN